MAGREDYKYVDAPCFGGIEQRLERIKPHQCADARNVWAPDGMKVEKRPGYVGIYSLGGNQLAVTSITGGTAYISDGSVASNNGNITLSLLGVGGAWYVGFTDNDHQNGSIMGFALTVVAANSTSSWAKAEYWNGTQWVWLPGVVEHTSAINLGTVAGSTLDAATNRSWSLQVGADWATSTIASQTLYWLRFTNSGSTFDASVTLSASTFDTYGLTASQFNNFSVAVFPTTKRYIGLRTYGTTHRGRQFELMSSVQGQSKTINSATGYTPVVGTNVAPHNLAILPEYDTCYIPFADNVFQLTASTNDVRIAKIEDQDYLVGPNAQYSKDFVAQRSTFPNARLITYFKGRLWAVEGDSKISWSAASPAHKVWPLLSTENVIENDNSPVRGIYGYDEHLHVFKNDSIYRMVLSEVNAFGLSVFRPIRAHGGAGAVGNNTFGEADGSLYWLGEKDVWRLGPGGLESVASGIGKYIQRITPSRRAFAAGVVWKSKNAYLLAVSLDGSDANNYVFVYDYEHKAWWVWDGLQVRSWLLDEDDADNEHLYFVDNYGRVFEFDRGLHDNGTSISSYVTTPRLGFRDNVTKTLRSVELFGSSLGTNVTVSAYRNDDYNATTSGVLNFSDVNETSVLGIVDRQRLKSIKMKTAGNWFQVKVAQSANTPWNFTGIRAGFVPLGVRR